MIGLSAGLKAMLVGLSVEDEAKAFAVALVRPRATLMKCC